MEASRVVDWGRNLSREGGGAWDALRRRVPILPQDGRQPQAEESDTQAVDASADRPQLSIDRERVIGQRDGWTEPGSLETKGFVILHKPFNHALGAADPLLPLSPPPYKTHCDPHVPYLALSFVF